MPNVCNSYQQDSAWRVLATGPGNPAVVRVLTGGSFLSCSRPGQLPDPLFSWRLVTCTGHRTVCFSPGWNWTMVPTFRFVEVCLQLSSWGLIVLWHVQYVDCAVLGARSLLAFRFAIWLIFVVWLSTKGHFLGKFAGFQSRLSQY
jgi:hypothetical protein